MNEDNEKMDRSMETIHIENDMAFALQMILWKLIKDGSVSFTPDDHAVFDRRFDIENGGNPSLLVDRLEDGSITVYFNKEPNYA